MPEIATSLPTALVSGNTWVWDRDYAEYPASSWTATAYFEKAGKTFSVAASASGSAHRFTAAAATTAAYPHGHYRIRVRVTDGSQVFIAESGYCDIEVDPAAAGTIDTRTWARRTLDNLLAFLEANAATAQATISIADRTIGRWQLKELDDWRLRLERIVRNEELGNRAASSRNIKVKYGRP